MVIKAIRMQLGNRKYISAIFMYDNSHADCPLRHQSCYTDYCHIGNKYYRLA